jgi:hypothetical protein
VEATPFKKIFWQRHDETLNQSEECAYDATLIMGVMKLKPVRTPRLLDEWVEEKQTVHKDAARGSRIAIENSKKLVAQSREIIARIRQDRKTNTKKKAG